MTNLRSKENHCDETQPAVQGIEVWYGRVCQIVRVKDGLQTNTSEDQSTHMQRGMKDLDVQLVVITKHSVCKDCCKHKQIGQMSTSVT